MEILLCFCGIKYVIDGDVLKIYSFWGIHEDIKISSITKIERSRCPLSSPAASLDRLAIRYNKNDVIYISPRRQEEFLEEIKNLRTKTGAGMSDCKKALTEANGDFDEAAKILRERGLAGAAKKAGRIAAEGVVDIMVDGGKAVIVEVNTETGEIIKKLDSTYI